MKTSQSMAAIAPGKPVKVGNITAVVTAHTIRRDASGKLYLAAIEITWWEGSERQCYDVYPCEATPATDSAERIGF